MERGLVGSIIKAKVNIGLGLKNRGKK